MNFDPKEFLTLYIYAICRNRCGRLRANAYFYKAKMGGLNAWKVTLISGALMVLFFLSASPFWTCWAWILNHLPWPAPRHLYSWLEMVLGIEFLNRRKALHPARWFLLFFRLIAGSGTLTTIMSLKATFERADKNEYMILLAILVNLIVIYIVLRSLNLIEKALGKAGLLAVRKFLA